MTTETNGQTDLEIIKSIQKKLLLAIEEGNDELRKQYADELAQARANVARKQEEEALKTELQNRDILRRRAEKIAEKCKAQGDAIDALLKARDEILPGLKEVVEKAKILPRLHEKTWEYYANAEQLGSNPRARVPKGYLPAKLKAATLEVKGGTRTARDVSHEALYFLRNAYALLAALERVDSEIPTREATLFEDVEDVLTSKKKKS